MEGMNKFQLTALIIFGFFILVGVIIFALGGLSSKGVVSSATIWGTLDSRVFDAAMNDSGLSQDRTISVSYVQKNPITFDQELVEALATGSGPDLFFLPNDSVIKHRAKIFPIPYANYSSRDFVNNFIEAGEVFLSADGALALPILVDPMVMYWNRDIFTNASLANPPRFWTEFYNLSILLTKKDQNLNVSTSATSLGEFTNVTNAFDLMSLLMMQAGSRIVQFGPDGFPQNLIAQPALATERALTFFTEFANPLRPYYSWNRSIPASKNFFLSGNLAIYFGFASELADLRLKNPNLNFDVASVPQSKDSERLTTVAKVTGVAISRNSKNISSAFDVATRITSQNFISSLARSTVTPPVRRDLLVDKPTQIYLSVFRDAAIQSRTWLVPDSLKTPAVFKEMIESVTGGRSTVGEAVSRLSEMVNLQLPR